MTSEAISLKAEISRLFSIMFYNPEETFLLEPQTTEALGACLKELDSSFGSDADIFMKSLADIDKTELMLDYAALFIGPYQLQAPPYGSVYLDTAKKLNDETTMEVLKIYRQFGLEVDSGMREPADHIAIELEFLHTAFIMLENEKSSDGGASEREEILEIFLSKYFKPFTEQMCALMQQNASTDFYKKLGSLLSKYSKNL